MQRLSFYPHHVKLARRTFYCQGDSTSLEKHFQPKENCQLNSQNQRFSAATLLRAPDRAKTLRQEFQFEREADVSTCTIVGKAKMSLPTRVHICVHNKTNTSSLEFTQHVSKGKPKWPKFLSESWHSLVFER